MTEPALQIVDLAKHYGERAILAGVSLDVQAGECFGLIGANGAGKTTLLRILVDSGPADRGTIRIFGTDHRQVVARRDFAFLPERFAPPPFATGSEWLRLLCALHEVHFDAADTAALCRQFALDDTALERRVGRYSKGMTQKLGLIGCLLVRPKLLILDEPMSGLDPRVRTLVRQRLLAEREQGSTLFFTTHQLSDLDELCDRFAVLHDGRIVFTGTAAEFRAAHGAGDLEQAYLKAIP
ncbi:MAG: ABC transporter ATP-binding protein [Gammaproteobacteria bacterium]|nr:ABC transporter ATP-binding protein [Gammaproteobacteria bacterium]